MTARRLLSRAVPALALALLLTGCGATIYTERREVDNLELIRTIGVDRTPEGVVLTAGTGTGAGSGGPRIYRTVASTLPEAVMALENDFARGEAFFAHTEHVLFGEAAAEHGIDGELDYIIRELSMRLATNAYIVEGATAEEAMRECASEISYASDMLTSIKKDVRRLAEGNVASVGETAASLAGSGCALVMAVEKAENVIVSDGAGETMLRPAGYAVLGGSGALLGYIDGDFACGACVLTGKAESAPLSVSYGGGLCTLYLSSAKVTCEPAFSGPAAAGAVFTLKLRFDFGGAESELNLLDADTRAALCKAAADEYRRRAEGAIARSQELGADCLGLGRRIEARCPARFRRSSPSWEEAFPGARFTVRAEAELNRTFDLLDPIKTTLTEGKSGT